MEDNLIYPEDEILFEAEDESEDLEISDFLDETEDFEDELFMDEIFEEANQEALNLEAPPPPSPTPAPTEAPAGMGAQPNLQPSAPHPPTHQSQPAGVMQPTTMHNESISPVPTVSGTEGTLLTPIEETANLDEDLSLFEETDEDSSIFNESDEEFRREIESIFEEEDEFEFNEANMDQAGQPLQQGQTQPPQGVTNMMGGSVGNPGSTPAANESAIADRTEGGTTGTDPSSAPMTQGYGAGPAVANRESIDDLLDEQGSTLSLEEDELIDEFDSLV